MKKSKVDKIIKRKVAEAASIARFEGQQDGRAQARKEFELLLVPPDDGTGVCVIGTKAEHQRVIVPIHPRYTPRFADPDTLDSYMMRDREYRRAIFEPVMRCQVFGTGQRVVWYNYRFMGLA